MRFDARAKDALRKIKITRNFTKYAEGSCLIELGNTKVICTASVEQGVPQFLKGTATGWVTSEYGMLPRSCKSRIQRDKNSGRTYEIQRLVGRCLRSIVDMACLGERTIWIDCDVIQADGGTRTASITGGFIALVDALNFLKKEKVFNKLPITSYIAAISVGIVDSKKILDLNYEEDSKAEVDMNVVMNDREEFIEVQGTSERRPFDKSSLDELLALAAKGIKELIQLQKESLQNIL